MKIKIMGNKKNSNFSNFIGTRLTYNINLINELNNNIDIQSATLVFG